MANKTEELKGRAKEAAGDLTGDDDLQREGYIDQLAASVKDVVDSWIKMVKSVFGISTN